MLQKLNNNRGSALLYVLVIIFLLALLVVAVLTASTNANRLSAFVAKYEQTYYDAESALNVAEAIFTNGLTDVPICVIGTKSDLVNMLHAILLPLKNEAENALENFDLDVDYEINYTINQDKIINPDLIYPGQVLELP